MPVEALAWGAAFAVVAVALVLTRFVSQDPDSHSYAVISARMAFEPLHGWIAPDWWGAWDRHGLYREHPIG